GRLVPQRARQPLDGPRVRPEAAAVTARPVPAAELVPRVREVVHQAASEEPCCTRDGYAHALLPRAEVSDCRRLVMVAATRCPGTGGARTAPPVTGGPGHEPSAPPLALLLLPFLTRPFFPPFGFTLAPKLKSVPRYLLRHAMSYPPALCLVVARRRSARPV